MNILLIEDDAAYAETVVFLFEMFAPADIVMLATTLQAALECIKLYRYEVIILDLNLPDARDMQALVTLSGVVSTTPILVLTAFAQWAPYCLEIGAKAYRVKSDIEGEALVALVHAIGEGRQ